ncbi:hypothetical protein T492DRAFT_840533 [Pavlovales sp. CCMP2436]|nr:hypothetical protein T492DRAFT_840533 [Pavlovales sp. CCMP2436]
MEGVDDATGQIGLAGTVDRARARQANSFRIDHQAAVRSQDKRVPGDHELKAAPYARTLGVACPCQIVSFHEQPATTIRPGIRFAQSYQMAATLFNVWAVKKRRVSGAAGCLPQEGLATVIRARTKREAWRVGKACMGGSRPERESECKRDAQNRSRQRLIKIQAARPERWRLGESAGPVRVHVAVSRPPQKRWPRRCSSHVETVSPGTRGLRLKRGTGYTPRHRREMTRARTMRAPASETRARRVPGGSESGPGGVGARAARARERAGEREEARDAYGARAAAWASVRCEHESTGARKRERKRAGPPAPHRPLWRGREAGQLDPTSGRTELTREEERESGSELGGRIGGRIGGGLEGRDEPEVEAAKGMPQFGDDGFVLAMAVQQAGRQRAVRQAGSGQSGSRQLDSGRRGGGGRMAAKRQQRAVGWPYSSAGRSTQRAVGSRQKGGGAMGQADSEQPAVGSGAIGQWAAGSGQRVVG